jgi:eukaryotic-like serine/threonine-protein kinase
MLLGHRYRLIRTIAVGGMGEVWEGHDESLGRQVAVKALRPEFAGESSLLQRFRVEAKNSAALSHPNIAPLFDYGEDDGHAYLVMELVPGEPLSDLLERDRVLPPQRLLPILSQTARGLHYAHQMGVVHRDVKPGNILVEPTGRVRITDFGVSQAINQTPMTATGMVMGTAQYLSPEQAIGRPATRLSDLYALGIIAYEAIVGSRPFSGASPVDIAIAQVNDPVPPLPASVDRRLASLVMRLLDKDPAGRPQSGDELANLFDQLIATTPPSGVPAAPRRRPAAAPTPSRESAAAEPAVLPPSFAPKVPVEPERPDRSRDAEPVTVGPRRLAGARGARARAVPGRPTVSPRPGAVGTRSANRHMAPPGPTPTWVRWAVLTGVAIVMIWLAAMFAKAVTGAEPVSGTGTPPTVHALSIPSSLSIRGALATYDNEGHL